MTNLTMHLDLRLPLAIEYTFHKKEGAHPAWVEVEDVSIGMLSDSTSIYDMLPDTYLDDLEERVLSIHFQENHNV